MTSDEIREKFLSFFEGHGHQRVASAGLVPPGDATLLFTNAGMVPFKDFFLGAPAGFSRATSCQKCVRAGGKHNDLENVGFTARHHTFFEMLGNFSFGDYFKPDAIALAWQLLTREYQLPPDKLLITVFESDDEAFDLWKGQGVAEGKISRLGEKDNFWAMGETGPCGPCSEIHYDWGQEHGCGKPRCAPGCDCGRFLEIWNLVFMQFERAPSGELKALPKPSVDTGAGLERLASVLQGVYSNYDTDLFLPLRDAIQKQTHRAYGQKEQHDIAIRVVADHLRASSFLIADGVTPSHEGRGYVLRRILRRAIRYGKKLGSNEPFLSRLLPALERSLGSVYPELTRERKHIAAVLVEEEERFHETLHRGMGLLESSMEECQALGRPALTGDIAFKLADTYGFPLDLIKVICAEKGLGIDEKDFEARMEKQRKQSGAFLSSTSDLRLAIARHLQGKTVTRFVGYEELACDATLLRLWDSQGQPTPHAEAPWQGYALLDVTPFYPEGGGQVGDRGDLACDSGRGQVRAEVLDTWKAGSAIVHQVSLLNGKLQPEGRLTARVDRRSRRLTTINHTATHLLHAALRTVLGDRVRQAGSLVAPERLRFDFTFPRPLTEQGIGAVESWVRQEVFAAHPVHKEELGYAEATRAGALAFFDEKYGERVRVVRVGGARGWISHELCGGTHLAGSGEIGAFKIVSEQSVASGVRRIEAVCSTTAEVWLAERHRLLRDLELCFGADGPSLPKKVSELLKQVKALTQENERLALQASGHGGSSSRAPLWSRAKDVHGIHLLCETLPDVSTKILRALVDQVKDKLGPKTMVLLASVHSGKVALCLGVSGDLTEKFRASDLIGRLASFVGGTGGGREDFAQAGGNRPEGLARAFQELEAYLGQAGSSPGEAS